MQDLEESFMPMKETIVHLFLIGFHRAKSRFNAPRVQAGERVPVVKKQMLVSCTMKRDQSGARLLRGTLVLLVFLSNFVSVPSASGAEPPNLAETRRLAEQGDAKAQFNLAGIYYTANGVPKDLAQAVEWLRKAAEQGNAAQYNLSLRVPQDAAQAVEWVRKAAEQGDADAERHMNDLEGYITSTAKIKAQELISVYADRIKKNQ